jgi:murein DD-endopeptidase MepM/ murein hydrolase activator NlpD
MGHLTRIVVVQGQKVEQGDTIGYINPDLFNGTRQGTGTITIACTTQPHVHYNVYMPTGYPKEAWGDTWVMNDPYLLSPKLGAPRPFQ